VTHEIRTPMTAILGFTEKLDDPQVSAAERAATIEIIRRNGQHLLSLINDILDESKIRAGEMKFESIPCSPARIVVEVGEMLSRQAERKGLALALEMTGEVPATIESDPFRLKQALVNLVSNAIKFTQTGRITIRMSQDQPSDQIVFDVIDTGIGLTDEQVQTIFEPFAQADGSTTRRYGGTGLGLSISRFIAEQLGGSICVTSAPKEGSTFRLRVSTGHHVSDSRVFSFDQTAELSQSAPARDQCPSLNGRILLVEDAEDSRRLFEHFLSEAGALVTTAANGRLGVEQIAHANDRRKPFDLILMDLQMPVMDGYQALAALLSTGCPTPIVALTAETQDGLQAKCAAAGFADFLPKPVLRQTLIATAAKWMGAKQASGQTVEPDSPLAHHVDIAPNLPISAH